MQCQHGSAFWSTLILSLVLASVTFPPVYAQSPDFNTTINRFNQTVHTDTFSGFTVEYRNWYRVLKNNVLGQTYALVCCGQNLSTTEKIDAIVNVPVTRVAVDGAMDVLPFIQLLGKQSSVVSISSYQNNTSPCFEGVTDTPPAGSTPDLIFSPGTQANTGAPHIAFSASSNTLTPIQKASWLVYIGYFFDSEAEAFSMYNNIVTEYECHRSNLEHAARSKSVILTAYTASNAQWTIYRDTYYSTLIRDAAGILLAPNQAQPNEFTNQMAFQLQLQNADYVLDLTPSANFVNVSYESWLLSAGLNAPPVYTLPFLSTNNVYRVDGLVDANGNSDWSERSAARPDLMLRDVIRMILPEYDENYTWTWLRNFANSDPTRPITPENYPCKVTDVIQCQPKTFQGDGKSDEDHSANPTEPLSKGGVAGVSVGAIIVVVLAAIIGFFAYRRYRSRQPKRTFYRMNDLS